MAKDKEYKFRIDAFSPTTIPMSRLGAYMSDLASVLGQPERVHFSHLEDGSTVLVQRVEFEAIPKVNERLHALRRGEATEDLSKAFKTLDHHLAEDNAIGELSYQEDEQTVESTVIRFPGRERPKPMDYGIVRQAGAIEGVLVSVGGRDRTAHVILEDKERSYTNIDVTRDLARKLAPHLFGNTLRLHGNGRWHREEDGQWTLRGFRVQHFEVLDDRPLSDAVDAIRAVPGSGWSETDEAIAILERLRKGPEHHL